MRPRCFVGPGLLLCLVAAGCGRAAATIANHYDLIGIGMTVDQVRAVFGDMSMATSSSSKHSKRVDGEITRTSFASKDPDLKVTVYFEKERVVRKEKEGF